jgi:hypothetical protein
VENKEHPAIRWGISAGISALGGGVAASVAALSDPSKYRFPQDLGSGKMWPFFLQGAGLVFVGMLLKSPMGQKVLSSVKESQGSLKESQQLIEDTKSDLGKSDDKPQKSQKS